jgi:CheY-like chemotaxis protein
MKTIFFVEDDAVIIHVYRAKFWREGFQVEVARDGLTAMKLLPAAKPDLVVLDLMMPRLNGVDVLRFIRSEPELKSTPVIILSNAFMTDLALEASKIGAELALLKSGCTPAQLVTAVNNLLEGKSFDSTSVQRLSVKHPTGKVVSR